MDTCTWDELTGLDSEREKWRLQNKLARIFKGAVRIYVDSDGDGGYHVYAEFNGIFARTKHEHVTSLTALEIEQAVPHATGRRKNGVPVYYR